MTGWIARSAVAAVLVAGCGGAAARPRPIALQLAALDGGEITSTSFRGQVVVLHAFTTGDLAAQGDVPQLNAADQRKDVVVIGIAVDKAPYPVIAGWRGGAEARYLVAVADDAFRAGGTALGVVTTIPTTVILDEVGRVTARIERPLGAGELATLIARAEGNSRQADRR